MFLHNAKYIRDVKVMPNTPTRNLWRRNGIYYFRQMINGRRILKSLGTDDINEARKEIFLKRFELMETNLYSEQWQFYVKWKGSDRGTVNNIEDLTQEEFDNRYILENVKTRMIASTRPNYAEMVHNHKSKHKIIDIWNSIPCSVKEATKQTYDTRINTVLENLAPYEYVEDLDDKLEIIDSLKNKLCNLRQKTGKSVEKLYAPKTIQEMLNLLFRVVQRADENNYIDNCDKIRKKLILKESERNVEAYTKIRKKLTNEDLYVLFRCLNYLLNSDTDFLTTLSGFDKTDKSDGKNTGLLQYSKKIIDNPQAFAYFCILALWLGLRANAVATIRHKDIEMKDITLIKDNQVVTESVPCIHFHKDMLAIANGDIRETYKELKDRENKHFDRYIPIPSFIWKDLKLENYLKMHQRTCEIQYTDTKNWKKYFGKHELPEAYGKNAFIFEEVIKTKGGYRPKTMNETINKLFYLLDLKPNGGEKFMKDFHSFKTTYYSFNTGIISQSVLETIAGNSVSDKSIVGTHYNDIDLSKLKEEVELIKYPYMELLLEPSFMYPTEIDY